MFLGFDFKEFFQQFFEKAEGSFKGSIKGEEDIKIVIRYWGIAAYIFFYFVIKYIVDNVDFVIIDVVLASFAIVYFSGHIYAVIKCKPKKEKISKAQRQKMKKDKMKRLSKSFTRKLLLQESISKWDPITVTIVADVFFIVTFLDYLT
jgi:hypothetical protein